MIYLGQDPVGISNIPESYPELIQDVSELKSEIDEKAAVINQTASGDIVSITDGADGIPLSACSVAVDPVQDLHGYANPWPAGGGANLAKPQVPASNQYYDFANDNGVYSIKRKTDASTNPRQYFTASFADIGLADGETYTAYCFEDEQYSYKCGIYNGSGGMAVLDVHTTAYTFTYSASTMSAYRLGVWSNSPNTLPLNTTISFHAMLVKGSTTPSSFATYSNICPISGHTETTVTRTGVNIFDGELEKAAINWTTYIFTPSPTGRWASKNYIRVEPGDYYISHAENNVIAVYDDASGNGGQSVSVNYTTHIFTVPAGKHYMKFGINVSDEPTNICINYPATDTEYHAYQGSTYPITFPDSAGTVYGGSITVNEDGTGQLVVDRGMYKCTGAEVLSSFYQRTNGDTYFTITGFSNVYYSTSGSDSATFVSDTHGTNDITPNAAYMSNSFYGFYIGSNEGRIRACIKGVSNSEQASAWLAENKPTIVYPLETPITYDLTAIEVLETLKGYNAIWADTGAISLTYPADTKSYVDDRTPVQDVQVNGTSILVDGVANVPLMSSSSPGVAKFDASLGTYISSSGAVIVNASSDSQIKEGINGYRPVVPLRQHASAFYGLAKAAGANMASSSNPVGTYTDAAKKAIQKMLGIPNTQGELIRQITTTEDLTELVINTDSNGNGFALIKMVALLSAPASTTGTKDSFYTEFTGKRASDDIWIAISAPSLAYPTATSTMTAKLTIDASSQGMPVNTWAVVSTTGNTQNLIAMPKDSVIKSISRLRIYQSGETKSLIPSGTTITVYGIRAWE